MYLSTFYRKLALIEMPVLVRCLVFAIALLPVPMIRTKWTELALLTLSNPVSGALTVGIEIFLWGMFFSLPLIPLFLAWSLPGAGRLGVPRRSIVALCSLIVYHPLRLHFEEHVYSPVIAKAVVEIDKQFSYFWVLKYLDTPVLIGLAAWAVFRRHTARPKEKILFHWGVFTCAIWAAGPLSDDYFNFLLLYYFS